MMLTKMMMMFDDDDFCFDDVFCVDQKLVTTPFVSNEETPPGLGVATNNNQAHSSASAFHDGVGRRRNLQCGSHLRAAAP